MKQNSARLSMRLPLVTFVVMLAPITLMPTQIASHVRLLASRPDASLTPGANSAGPNRTRRANLDPRRRQSHPLTRAVVLVGFGCLAALGIGRGGEPPPATPIEKGKVQVLVAYHSRTGNTEQMAQGVVEGIRRVPGAAAILKKVGEVSKADLEAADGIVLGSPTYFANVPGEMKAILDDWNWKLKVDFTDKVGGAFATAGGQVGGQEHVVVSLLLFMVHNRMIVAGPLYRNEKTGSVWAESGAAAVTGPLDPGVGEGELDGARRLGERVAKLAARLKQ